MKREPRRAVTLSPWPGLTILMAADICAVLLLLQSPRPSTVVLILLIGLLLLAALIALYEEPADPMDSSDHLE